MSLTSTVSLQLYFGNRSMTAFESDFLTNVESLPCRYYKRSVSGRMLSEKSISDYLEQAFVSKVKLTCGANHVSQIVLPRIVFCLSNSTPLFKECLVL